MDQDYASLLETATALDLLGTERNLSAMQAGYLLGASRGVVRIWLNEGLPSDYNSGCSPATLISERELVLFGADRGPRWRQAAVRYLTDKIRIARGRRDLAYEPTILADIWKNIDSLRKELSRVHVEIANLALIVSAERE